MLLRMKFQVEKSDLLLNQILTDNGWNDDVLVDLVVDERTLVQNAKKCLDCERGWMKWCGGLLTRESSLLEVLGTLYKVGELKLIGQSGCGLMHYLKKWPSLFGRL